MSENHSLNELQTMLNVLAPGDGPFETGVYGEHTRRAVERFRKRTVCGRPVPPMTPRGTR